MNSRQAHDHHDERPVYSAASFELPAVALEAVRTRRIFALVFDLFILSFLVFALVIMLTILGIPTAGFSLLFIPVLLTLFPLVALLYNGITISGWRRATPGMRMMDLEMRLTNASRVPFLYAAAHAILFYLSTTVLTPFIMLVSLFSLNKRCLHDMLTNVVVTRRQRKTD